MDIEYSKDLKNVIFKKRPYTSGAELVEVAIPVEVLDFFFENNIQQYDLEKIFTFHRRGRAGAIAGVPQPFENVQIKDLVGRDLTGYQLEYYFPNWEDSEWWSTSSAIAVVAVEGKETTYRLSFGEENDRKFAEYYEGEGEIDASFEQVYYDADRFISQEFDGFENFVVVKLST